MYGKLWCFEKGEAHRFTSKAILSGTLHLRSAVSLIDHDEQIYNGAGYTNWGFGVPLLQAPFHFLAGLTHIANGFFPDRAIYFFYCISATPIIWAGIDGNSWRRRGDGRDPRPRKDTASPRIMGGNLVVARLRPLTPLMQTRFIVYEETIAYFTIFELLAISAYIFAQRSERLGPILGMGAASGVGLLVRPTGLITLGVWGAVVALRQQLRATFAFAQPWQRRSSRSGSIRTGFAAWTDDGTQVQQLQSLLRFPLLRCSDSGANARTRPATCSMPRHTFSGGCSSSFPTQPAAPGYGLATLASRNAIGCTTRSSAQRCS